MDIYNTATKRVEEFHSREAGCVSLYVCGVTPYDALHLGHARTFLTYDMIRRYFEWRGVQVTHVQNITDIDDKIIQRAQDLHISPGALADTYTHEALEDCDALGILRAHRYPRVTEHVPEILAIIQALLARGYAYVTPEGSVYYRVRAFPRYGCLSGRSAAALVEAPERKDAAPGKESPGDFALWKSAKAGEPHWVAPWGKGRPGWHIECSAMSTRWLGSQIDLHGGGIELLFPHHENEVAQTEAYTGVSPAVRCWIHCGVVTVNGRKMAKSVGNVCSVKDALAMAPSNVWRLLFLSSHYRSPLDFSGRNAGGLTESIAVRLAPMRSAWRRIEQFFVATGTEPVVREDGGRAVSDLARACTATRRRFFEAMENDFGTPAALTEVFSLIAQAKRTLFDSAKGESIPLPAGVRAARRTVRELLAILGFTVLSGPA